MVKIVVTNNQDLSKAQTKRLDALGDVTYYDSLPQSAKEYLERVKDADIICSGTAGLKDAYPQLKNVYVTVPFVSVSFVDLATLKKNNVTLSNAPGANRHAVSEWIVGMMIYMVRDLPAYINREETLRKDGNLPPVTMGLAERNITILGKGNVGKRVGEVAAALGMQVRYFTRDDNLAESVKNADVVVDTLSSNPDTINLLDKQFFDAMKPSSYFITVTRQEIVDTYAMLEALDSGKLRGIATDCGGILVGDAEDPYYKKLRSHSGVLATPHVSYSTEMSMQTGNDIMIDNVEAWLEGEPKNVATSR